MRALALLILAGGSINSPQLLQLSGVGPAEVLRANGIAVRHDLPVGRHLQDHLCYDHTFRSKVPSLNDDLLPWSGKLKAGLRYVLTRKGPLALSVNQGGGFFRSRPDAERPNIQLYFSPLTYTKAPPDVRALMAPDPFSGFIMSVSPCRPTSARRNASGGPSTACSPSPATPPRPVGCTTRSKPCPPRPRCSAS
jgi:choline dehydrogenase